MILGRLLGYVSVLVNLALAMGAFGLGLVGAWEGAEMYVDFLPVEPEEVSKTLLFSGIIGVVIVLLAVRAGRFSRTPHVLWSLLAPGLLLCAVFRPNYRIDGVEQLEFGAWVFVASLVVFVGSVLHWKLAPGRIRR